MGRSIGSRAAPLIALTALAFVAAIRVAHVQSGPPASPGNTMIHMINGQVMSITVDDDPVARAAGHPAAPARGQQSDLVPERLPQAAGEGAGVPAVGAGAASSVDLVPLDANVLVPSGSLGITFRSSGGGHEASRHTNSHGRVRSQGRGVQIEGKEVAQNDDVLFRQIDQHTWIRLPLTAPQYHLQHLVSSEVSRPKASDRRTVSACPSRHPHTRGPNRSRCVSRHRS